MRPTVLGLSATSLLWGLAFLFDPRLSLHHRLPHPLIMFILHWSIGIALIYPFRATRWAGLAMCATATYYALMVKPFEPIAEPQTVGIAALSAFVTFVSIPRVSRLSEENSWLAGLLGLLFRGGIAYPFFEWGLDAYRNPAHFKHYITENSSALLVASIFGLDTTVYLIFAVELALAVMLVSDRLHRATGIISAALLTLFTIVAGYPLALPQNITLIAASLEYVRLDGKLVTSST